MGNNLTIPTKTESDFHPRLLRPFRKIPWAALVGAMLIGAILGFTVSLVVPPVYEAKSVVTTNMELVPDTNITEIMVDAEIDMVGTLVYHPDIIQALIQSEKEQGNTLTLEDLKHNGGFERQLMSTIIKYRSTNPETAAHVASEWARVTYERLSSAYPYALAVSAAKAQLTEIESCLNDATKQSLPFCQSLTAESASALREEANQVITKNSPLTLGLTSALNVSQYQPAAIPSEPLWYHRGYLMLAGLALGFVFGVIWIEAQPSKVETDEG